MLIDRQVRNAVAVQKWIEEELNEIPRTNPPKKILDAGAGECKNKKYCGHLEYISQDLCEYGGKGNGKGLQRNKWDTSKIDIVCDIRDMPINSDMFDIVLCSEVLEHVYKPEEAIKEMARVLKQGGIMLLTAPFCSLTHFAPYHYSTGFNVYWYRKVLEDNGCRIVSELPIGNFFDYLRQEIGRVPYVKRQFGEGGGNSVLDKFMIGFINEWLFHCGRKDRSSSQILCFDYCIKAEKANRLDSDK